MKITNLYNLPQVIVDAVTFDPYHRGDSDITVTQLIQPPRKIALEKRHAEQITEDASDKIWSLLGQAVHVVLERAEATAVTEERLYLERLGWKIGGKFDRFSIEDGVLQDFKVTTSYSVMNGAKKEWEAQLNLLAHLLRESGKEVKRLEIITILRDWSHHQATANPNYPQCQVTVLQIPLWESEVCEEYIFDRVQRHQSAKTCLPMCTEEEKWSKPTKWAVKKEGGKRAVRVFDTEEEAKGLLMELGSNYCIEKRQGTDLRCEKYCSVAAFCR